MDITDINIQKFVTGPIETNCYVVYDGSGEGLIIDPGQCEKRIIEFIGDKQLEIVNILNTHGHADHIAGNAGFGYPVMIHRDDESFLYDERKNLSFLTGTSIKPVQPARLLRDKDTIKIGALVLEVIHTPGHTPGGISLRCGSYLFGGDTLFFEGIGRSDLPYGDQDALIRSIRERLLILPDDIKVLPGHGPETTIGHEKHFNPFL